MGGREGDKMDKFGCGGSHRSPSKTLCHPGLDPGPISRSGHSRKVGGAGRPGGVGRNLEMGPGLRRGDIGGEEGLEQKPRARQVQSPRVKPEGDGPWMTAATQGDGRWSGPLGYPE